MNKVKQIKVRLTKRHYFLYYASVLLILLALHSLYLNFAPAVFKYTYLNLRPVIHNQGEVLRMESTVFSAISVRVYGIDYLRCGMNDDVNSMVLLPDYVQTSSWIIKQWYGVGQWDFRVDGNPERGLPDNLFFSYCSVRSLICLDDGYKDCVSVNSKPFPILR